MSDRAIGAGMALDRSPLATDGERPRFLAWIAYATICVIWGTTYLAVRVAIETVPTLLVTAIRFLGFSRSPRDPTSARGFRVAPSSRCSI